MSILSAKEDRDAFLVELFSKNRRDNGARWLKFRRERGLKQPAGGDEEMFVPPEILPRIHILVLDGEIDGGSGQFVHNWAEIFGKSTVAVRRPEHVVSALSDSGVNIKTLEFGKLEKLPIVVEQCSWNDVINVASDPVSIFAPLQVNIRKQRVVDAVSSKGSSNGGTHQIQSYSTR